MYEIKPLTHAFFILVIKTFTAYGKLTYNKAADTEKYCVCCVDVTFIFRDVYKWAQKRFYRVHTVIVLL